MAMESVAEKHREVLLIKEALALVGPDRGLNDGHLVQAGESGDPYSHLKRPGDSKNHVRTTVSKTADCGNDKKQARRTSSPSRHDSLSCTVPAHAAMPPVQDRLSMQNRIVHCLFCTATCTASRLNNM